MRGSSVPLLVFLWLMSPGVGGAQEKPAAVAEFDDFRGKPLDGWEWEEDERLGDLIAQLREKESSLQALDARIAKAMGKKAGAKMDESMAWRNVNRMDLNGGGPIRWDAFYGRNAEKFFYHPVDPQTTYRTNTLLRQTDPTAAGGVPGNQGVPAHQRPPQFDYIYRGWERDQQRAKEKADELKGELDRMVARRRELEQDVVILWCKLAFRIIDKEKLPEKPVLRWAALPRNPGVDADVARANVLTAATRLLATALLFNEAFVERDAATAFATVDAVIKKSRQGFEDGLLQAATLLDESEDVGTALGKYKRLARKLEDVSKSLTEGYRGWQEGDRVDDEPAKYASLRRIQDSVVTYSQILLSLNELVGVMKKEWATTIDTKTTEFTPAWDVASIPKAAPVGGRDARTGGEGPAASVTLTKGGLADNWQPLEPAKGGNWDLRDGVLVCRNDGTSLVSKRRFADFELQMDFKLPPRCNSGIYLRGCYEIQLLDATWRSASGEPAKPLQRTGAVYGQIAPAVDTYRGPNQWNTLVARLQGNVLTVHLNGKKIIDAQAIPKPSPGGPCGDPRMGPIMIQSHSEMSGAQFRNCVVTPIGER